MKSLYILLTRTQSIVSKTVHFFTKDTYTHASIAFDENLDFLCSSARKNGINMFPAGPCREYLTRGFLARKGKTPCAVFRLQVPEEVFDRALAEVNRFLEHEDEFKFSVLGIMACKFGIAWERKNKYFCSQFVSHILRESGAVALPKIDCLMRPSDFMSLENAQKVFEGDIGDVSKLKTTKNKDAVVSLA